MFYKMIQNACARWFITCPVKDILRYIKARGEMRDAQFEAIRTWLFLKIGCNSRPLSELFREGAFNTLSLNDLSLSATVRDYLSSNPAAAALYEYAMLSNEGEHQLSTALEEQIKTAPESIDCERFFRDAFYGVSYTDYLFSLPMGAGKTYLMAAFIYLELYFAMNEPQNPAFAHNFMILAPSGLKSSVVPSLKTIRNYDPSWVLPEPSASEIRRKLIFEVLDGQKTAKKSNRTKNPNVQKIAEHQPLWELEGFVAVTNAEKVILDRIDEQDGQIMFREGNDDEKDRQANELRSLIGTLPNLSVFIDEVHHAVSSDIKLRAVINQWAAKGNVNSVIGFSGTPYLDKAEKTQITDTLSVASAEISNIVYYYPLIDGVGNFLKRPEIRIENVTDSARIIENGVRLFLDRYRDTVYGDGTAAKLGVYCGTIEKLEELVYPLISNIVSGYGLPADCVLRFHKGNKQYPQPADSQMQFDTLDKPSSKIRIVLLVQIGKEGWDCRSLTGIILSQEGDCPRNMVLQTSCRCLRQVDRDADETALIYLNESNGKKLESQLKQQQKTSIKELNAKGPGAEGVTLRRYDRTKILNLPPIPFYQLKVNYETFTMEPPDIPRDITNATEAASGAVIRSTDLNMQHYRTEIDDAERGSEPAVFSAWLYAISNGGFGTPSVPELNEWKDALRGVFQTITYERDGIRYFSSRYNKAETETNIRKAFREKRSFKTREELIPASAKLLNVVNFTLEVVTDKPDIFYPSQTETAKIIEADKGNTGDDEGTRQLRELAAKLGNAAVLETLRQQYDIHPGWERSFHYLPYRTDSKFEQRFLKEIPGMADLERLGLEAYYNGDDTLTEFKIRCFKRQNERWRYIGMYTPDFLIIQRRDGAIYKAMIVETKGQLYAHDPTFQDKRKFTETEFLRMNNAQNGVPRFDYLYLEDSMSEDERILTVHKKMASFFGGQ